MSSSSQDHQLDLDSALYLDKLLSVWQFTCAVIGIPLNAITIAVVLGLRRLHLHRTFTWLIVGLANLVVLISCLLEVLAVHWPESIAVQLCAWLKGIPTRSFIVFVSWFLSLLERHLCLRYPNWYKRHITSCRTLLSVQIGSFAIPCLLMKYGRPFIFPAPFRLHEWNLLDVKFNFGLALAGFFLCVGTHVAVTIVSNRRYASVSAVVSWIALNPVNQTEERHSVTHGLATEEDLESAHHQESSTFVCIGSERVSRLDLEAARSMTINCGLLFIAAIPALVTMIGWITCKAYAETSSSSSSTDLPISSSNCSDWARVFTYARLIPVSVHCSFISPALFVALSRDLRSALRDRGVPWV